MREFVVEFRIRVGLGPEWRTINVSVGLDDLPEEMTEKEIQKMAIEEAESRFYKSEDYPLYGKYWLFQAIYCA